MSLLRKKAPGWAKTLVVSADQFVCNAFMKTGHSWEKDPSRYERVIRETLLEVSRTIKDAINVPADDRINLEEGKFFPMVVQQTLTQFQGFDASDEDYQKYASCLFFFPQH